MWSIAPMISTAAALSAGVTWATLPVFMAGFCPLLIFAASFVNKGAYWQLGVFDYTCGIFSILALVLWALTKNPNIAIVFALLSDFLAGVPTLRKAWSYPETETAYAYSLGVLGSATSFFVIRDWTFASWAFPAYLVLINFFLAAFVLRKYLNKTR